MDLNSGSVTLVHVLRMAGGGLEFYIVQKLQILSDAGTCPKPHSQWPHGSILDAWSTFFYILSEKKKNKHQIWQVHSFKVSKETE